MDTWKYILSHALRMSFYDLSHCLQCELLTLDIRLMLQTF